jgi:hypothetical protein
VYQSTAGKERDDDQAHHLLHELANDLGAIQMRTDILASTLTPVEVSTSPLVQTDLAILRATAQHAITLAEQVALVLAGIEPSALEEPEA